MITEAEIAGDIIKSSRRIREILQVTRGKINYLAEVRTPLVDSATLWWTEEMLTEMILKVTQVDAILTQVKHQLQEGSER